MLTPLDFLADLTNPMLTFLPKALIVSMLAAIVCGVVGSHVILRGMTFIGDAVAHAVFPGVAIAFVLQASMLLGGIVAGVVVAVLVALFSQSSRLREDSVIGVFYVASFALGVVVLSFSPGYAGSLTSFLFGSITGIPDEAVPQAMIMAAFVLVVLACCNRQFVVVSFDREYARSLGMPVLALDVVLYVLVTLAVVMSIQTIGNILVLALLVTPAAAGRMLTDKLGAMMAIAAAIGMLTAFFGLYLSWALDLPTGATIVLACTVVFLLAWLMGPKHGVLRSVTGPRGSGGRAQATADA